MLHAVWDVWSGGGLIVCCFDAVKGVFGEGN